MIEIKPKSRIRGVAKRERKPPANLQHGRIVSSVRLVARHNGGGVDRIGVRERPRQQGLKT